MLFDDENDNADNDDDDGGAKLWLQIVRSCTFHVAKTRPKKVQWPRRKPKFLPFQIKLHFLLTSQKVLIVTKIFRPQRPQITNFEIQQRASHLPVTIIPEYPPPWRRIQEVAVTKFREPAIQLSPVPENPNNNCTFRT